MQVRKDMDSQLLLLSIQRVAVAKIACSNKHTLIVSPYPLNPCLIGHEYRLGLCMGRE